MEKRKIGQTAESLSEKLIQLLKSGGGDIPIKELRELTSTMSEQEHVKQSESPSAVALLGQTLFWQRASSIRYRNGHLE